MSESESKGNIDFNGIIIIAFILMLVFACLFYSKINLAKRRDFLRHRYLKLENLIKQKVLIKKKIDRFIHFVTVSIVLFSLSFFSFLFYLLTCLHYFNFNPKDFVVFLSEFTLVAGLILLIIYNKVINTKEALELIKCEVELFILKWFRKESLQRTITENQEELVLLREELRQIDQELSNN